MYSALVLFPFFSIIILNLPLRSVMKKLAFWLALLLTVIQICTAISFSNCVLRSYLTFFDGFLRFDFAVDGLSRIMLLSIALILLVTLLAAKHLISDEDKRFNFINLLLLILSGMNGIVMVKDIFSLYVFLEITAAASFILIAFNKEEGALEAAFKYIIMSSVATIMMLASIALLMLVSGDTSFSAISAALKTSANPYLIMLAIGIFLCALFVKAGLMPFHGWLPDAYSAAPSSVSVLLAGIVTKTLGVYTLIRLVTAVFGFNNSINQALMLVGTISIVLGALAALTQSDFKRMLAYSSISQVGYIIVGLGCGSALGIAGAAFHLFNHSVFKSLLFVNAAAVEHQTGKRNMDNMSGLAEKMPLTGITSAVGFLSAAGIPPLAGFWSKLIIVIALWISGYYVFAVIAILASILTLAYFLSMQRRVFFGKLGEEFTKVKEAGFLLSLAAIMLAAIIVAVGLCFPFVLDSFILPVGNILKG